MIFPRGVDVLRLPRVVDQRRNGSPKVPAILENVEHRPPFFVKFQALVQLHLARQPRVVPLHEDHAAEYLPNLLFHAQPPASVPNRGVGNAADVYALLKLRLHQIGQPPRNLAGRTGHADVRFPRHAAVKLLVPVDPPLFVHRPNAKRKRPRVSVVEADHPRPVPWNFERFDDVRVQPVLVVRRVVRKLRKSLPVECIPFAQKQRFPQRLGLLFQLDDVVPRHMRIVHRRRRDVFNPPHAHLAEHAALHRRFGDALPRARRVHKSRFHPCVPRPAGVACASHTGRNAQPLFRAQPRPQVVIHGFREMRELVEIQPVDLRALVLEQPFALVAQVAEVNHASVAQPQLVRAGDILAQFLRRNAHHRAHQRHFQFGIGSPE